MTAVRSLLCILFALALTACERRESAPMEVHAIEAFKANQVWTYKTRPGEESSRIIICRFEQNEVVGEIVHISVNGVRLEDRQHPGKAYETIGHLPYAAEALRNSVITFESNVASLPSFEDGYEDWRRNFDQGKAGVWTVSVSEAVDFMETTLNR